MTQRTSAPTANSAWKLHEIRLISRKMEIPIVETFEFEFVDSAVGQQYVARAGQFNMLYIPGYGEAAISTSGVSQNTGNIVHTIRQAGNVTNAIFRLELGQTLGCRGPYGNGWPLRDFEEKHLILIGGGIGMAPLRSVIESLRQSGWSFSKVTILIGGRSPDSLLYSAEYDQWRSSGFEVLTTVDHSTTGWQGNIGVVPSLLDRIELSDPNAAIVMCCGPEVMMNYSALAAIERGIPEDQIFFSLERHMNCAIGHCGRCQLGSYFLCTNGPVFRYNQVKELMKIPEL